ncbi:hypothetical protein FO519_003818 [Halicephalobus sp. NKZ332]|nr:hypothetical protein FO519_003818 [Halicephalobus sp. NKZ332]
MSDQEDSPDLTPRERESMSNIPAKKGPVGDPRLNLPFYAGVKFQVNKGSETSDKQRTKKPDEKNDDPESPTPKKSKASSFALQNPEVNYPTADNNVLAKTTFASNFSDENSRTTNDMDRRKEDQEGQKSGLDGARKTGLKKSKPGSSNYKGPKNANLEPLGSNVVSFLKPTNPKPTSVTDPSAMLNPYDSCFFTHYKYKLLSGKSIIWFLSSSTSTATTASTTTSTNIPTCIANLLFKDDVSDGYEYPALMDTVKATINKHKGSHYLTEKNRKEIFEATDKVFRYNEEIYHRALKYRHDLENCVKDYRKIRSQFESSQETLLKITEDFKVYIADAGPKLANYENLLRRNDELEKKTKNLEKTFGIQQNLMNVHMKKFEDFRRTTEKRETEFNRLKADVQKKDEELEDRKIRIMDLEEHVESLQEKLKLEKERRMIKSQEKKATIKKMRTEIENYRSFMIKMNEKYREASISQMQLMAKLKRRSYRIKQLKEQIKTTKAGPVEKGNSPILNSMSVQNREKSNTPEVFPPKLDEYDSPGFLTIEFVAVGLLNAPDPVYHPPSKSRRVLVRLIKAANDKLEEEVLRRVIKLVENGEEDQTMEELASGEVIDFNRDISETINRALSSRINNEEKDSDRPVENEELGRMFLDRNWEEAENVVDHVKSEIEESEFVTEEMNSFRGTNTEPHFGPLDQQDDRGVEELLTPQTEELESANSRVSDGDYYFRLLLNAFENRDNSLEPEEANREASDAAIKSIDEMRKSCGRKRSIIHQIPCCNYDIAPEILKACEHVGFDVEKVLCHLPPQIVFTLRPGYVICEGGLNPMDRKTVAIWSGDAMSDFSYEPTILGARIINFPPQITYTSNGYGNIPFGKVIVDVEYEHYSEVAYLSDEMMSKYQVYLFVDELNFEKLNNGLSEVRFTGASYNRNCNPITLMTISAFHKTRFGSFREIPNENPRPPLTVRLQSQESGCSSTSVADVNEDFPKTDYGNSKQYVPMTVLKDLLTASQLRIIERLGYHT